MKFLSLLIISFIFLQFTAFTQEGWLEQTSVIDVDLHSVFFIDSNVGWSVGDYHEWNSLHGNGIIMKTSNSGNTWFRQDSSDFLWRDVYFINSDIGFVVGQQLSGGPPITGAIMKTTNGGEEWIISATGGMFDPKFRSICFTDVSNGWVVFKGGGIWNTTDGGDNWNDQTSGTTEDLYSVHFISNNLGWAAGSSSIIIKTTNSGQDWIEQLSYTTGSVISSVFFIDENNGWAAGNGRMVSVGNKIWNTTNGGNDWNLQEWEGSGFNSIFFIDNMMGWVVGNGGAIYKTTNEGIDWVSQTLGVGKDLCSVYFINNNLGWAVGDSGLILHTTNGGVSFIEEQEIDDIPTDYTLSQNYPNPFNPSTKIKYSIPRSSNVVIKVFDILSNEIETLVNEEKTVGTYEITWYAEGLPSGVYFYKIKAGSFIETKKMLLLK